MPPAKDVQDLIPSYILDTTSPKARPIVALVERGGNVGRAFRGAQDSEASADEYVRRDFEADPDATQWQESVHTNSAEGYFSIFKRGMKGIYQHCGEKHLHRYLAEYDFRYNHRVKLGFNDTDRATIAVAQASGKRLTYRQAH